MELLEENIEKMLQDTRISKEFFFEIPKSQETIVKTDKRNFIKLKSFCQRKETIKKAQTQPTKMAKNIFNPYL
jgi:hypothetical protein